jgi:hypothetical protein
MENFTQIEHVDAFYIEENTLERVGLHPHVAYGQIIEKKKDSIVFSFVHTFQDSKISKTGILIPEKAPSPEYKKYSAAIGSGKVGNSVSVYWDDVIYYENVPPESITKMYIRG